jgi:hypothetical protein
VDGWIVTSSITETLGGFDPVYSPCIAYTYEVGSDPLFNTKVSFAAGEGERLKKAHKKIAKYPIGKIVKVFHNPARPLKSVLEPGEGPRTRDRMAFAILFLVIGRLIYANPEKKIQGAKVRKNSQPPDLHVHVHLQFNFLVTCLWVVGSIIMARMFDQFQHMAGFTTMFLVILAGVIIESIWRKSWRVFRHNKVC